MGEESTVELKKWKTFKFLEYLARNVTVTTLLSLRDVIVTALYINTKF